MQNAQRIIPSWLSAYLAEILENRKHRESLESSPRHGDFYSSSETMQERILRILFRSLAKRRHARLMSNGWHSRVFNFYPKVFILVLVSTDVLIDCII